MSYIARQALTLIRTAVQAGGPLIAGTDDMATPDDPYSSLLAELEYRT